ncbi:hypothetical protein [Enterococcus malodoratus]|uniref:Uncharacterized protein n=1 Tax=Enterococcus malodoratus ATCC 43197 TaxID=1158601 RepID=R2QKE2_9ENTE|nr:hypothetical protein [Enterococcus malodoratus]EOH72135.1 hypothetical protein UAI_04419 [Enterococcus malodoratus ATCC 43197]EOT69841.1 hypothetical protein I585_01320 [Enterococcus malodoratus ATCC 43197]OJG58219.1 hypothetical protein RV07_GL003139 [Enterococcus malodoratus]SPX01479.1 Uncharacterised protein [Enterococcus malodoratus]STC70807.1 Uncharacterised protein [Enterococcus malodoratus]
MGGLKLERRQIFGMKKESLFKRVVKYFEQTKNVSEIVEVVVAIIVRDAICGGETFAGMFKELIRDLYFTANPNDTLRRFSPYFEEYFSHNEWQTVKKRLYKNKNFYECTKEARSYKDYLEQEATLDIRQEQHIYCVESFFEDSNGKRHKLTIRDTDPNQSEEVIVNALRILTTLSIFSKDGVRQFAKFVNYVGSGKTTTTSYDTRRKEPAESVQETDSTSKKEQKQTQRKKATATVNKEVPPKKTSKMTPQEIADMVDARYPMPGEVPLNNPNDSAESAKMSAAALMQKPDTSYMRYAKSEEQVQKGREEKRTKKTVDKKLGKKKKRSKKR